jgi:hypothetical protein
MMIPFIASKEMWQRGVGGSIPSMVAYVFGVIGIFRLVRGVLSRGVQPDGRTRVAAWTAAIVYGANPNLIYMQTTAMGEALYLALFVWVVIYFGEFVRGDAKALTKCGLCLGAACLTRYDGWFLAVAVAFVVVVLQLFPGKAEAQHSSRFRVSRGSLAKFLLLAVAAPGLWLAYNGIVYRNPLEFANGPYSAKAIERRTQNAGNTGHPGSGNVLLAGMYFLKSAEANMAESEWLQRTWVLLGIAGAVAVSLRFHKSNRLGFLPAGSWIILLLLIPVPFYALSVAYGGVPIFIPRWWPFSHYNVRYGLQLLPAFAAFLSVLLYMAVKTERWTPRFRPAAVLLVVAFVLASYALIWRNTPISLNEAQINMRTRNQLEAQLAIWLQKLPPESTLLMYLGDHVGALQQAGIPLKRTINEGNHRTWKQPADPEGLWERALEDPSRYADYVVAFEGDSVWQAIHDRHLPEIVEIHVTGQARAILYRAR